MSEAKQTDWRNEYIMDLKETNEGMMSKDSSAAEESIHMHDLSWSDKAREARLPEVSGKLLWGQGKQAGGGCRPVSWVLCNLWESAYYPSTSKLQVGLRKV